MRTGPEAEAEGVGAAKIRGCGAAGSAPAWHAGGQGFESPQLHQRNRWNKGLLLVPAVFVLSVADMISRITCDFQGGDMEGTVQPNPRTRRGWIWLIAAGFSVSITGIVVGVQKTGPLCGSALMPQSRAAEIFDALRSGSHAAAECYRSVDSAAAPTWTLIVLGIALVLAGVIIRVVSINRYATGSASPSVVSQIEELARLQRQGLISDDELNTRRAELLNRL
jgi:hypothetical protein